MEAYDHQGQHFVRHLDGFEAVVAQHECDHLDGVLYVDKADTKSLAFLSAIPTLRHRRIRRGRRIMGFLGKLFGTDPESKLAKARKFLDTGEFHEARWVLEGLDHPKPPPSWRMP